MRISMYLLFATMTLPVSAFAQSFTGTGTVRFFDRPYAANDVLFCDSLHVDMTNVTTPDGGTKYFAWLIDDTDTPFALGQVSVSSGTISFGYASTTQNLVHTYKSFIISQETSGFSGSGPTFSNLRYAGSLFDNPGAPGPQNALTYIRNVIGKFQTPNDLGLFSQMVRQTFKSDNFVQHATLATTQSTVANVKVHTNHSFDFVSGTPDPRVASGTVANNGDPLGYGLRRYADLETTYSAQGGAGHHIGTALAQSDAPAAMIEWGNNALASLNRAFGTDNASGLAKSFTDKCLEIIGKTYANVGLAQADATQMKGLAAQLQDSILVAYAHALRMATIDVEPVILPPGAPTLLAPADGATGVALNPTLSWNAVASADSYAVQLVLIQQTGMPPDILVLDTTIVDTTLAVGPLQSLRNYTWSVIARNSAGEGPSTARGFTTVQGTGVQEDGLPEGYALRQNFPNPFNPETEIRFQTTDNRLVRLSVYDVLGRHVATLVDDLVPAGEHTARWDASDVPSGVYLFRLDVRGERGVEFRAVRRGALVR